MATNKNKINDNALKFIQKGQLKKAIKEYEKILDEDPNDVRTLLKKGDLLVRVGEKDEAVETYLKVASAYSQQGFHLKAVAVFKQILKIDDGRIDINLRLADEYQNLGIISDAMTHLQVLAEHYERQGMGKEALDIFKRIVELDPDNVAIRIKLAELYSSDGMVAEAVEEFSKAAASLKNSNRIEDYIKVAERLVFHDSSNVPLVKELANIYLQRGDTKRALGKLQVCFKADPRDLETLNLLSQAFRDLNQLSKTVSVYKEMAKIYQEQGATEETQQVYRRVLEIVPDDAEALQVVSGGGVLMVEAVGDVTQERSLPAVEALVAPGAGARLEARHEDVYHESETPILELAPNEDIVEVQEIAPPPVAQGPDGETTTEQARENISRLLTETDVYIKYGLQNKAFEHLERVFKQDPTNIEAHEKLKDLYSAAGQEEHAVSELLLLSQLTLRIGRQQQARAYLRNLLSMAPSHPEGLALARRLGAETSGEPEDASVEKAEPASRDSAATHVIVPNGDAVEEVEAGEDLLDLPIDVDDSSRQIAAELDERSDELDLEAEGVAFEPETMEAAADDLPDEIASEDLFAASLSDGEEIPTPVSDLNELDPEGELGTTRRRSRGAAAAAAEVAAEDSLSDYGIDEETADAGLLSAEEFPSDGVDGFLGGKPDAGPPDLSDSVEEAGVTENQTAKAQIPLSAADDSAAAAEESELMEIDGEEFFEEEVPETAKPSLPIPPPPPPPPQLPPSLPRMPYGSKPPPILGEFGAGEECTEIGLTSRPALKQPAEDLKEEKGIEAATERGAEELQSAEEEVTEDLAEEVAGKGVEERAEKDAEDNARQAVEQEADESSELEDSLEEVDFFVQQNLLEEAFDALAVLKESHPDHPGVQERAAKLDRLKKGEAPLSGVALEDKKGSFDLAAELEKQVSEDPSGFSPVDDFQYSVDDVLSEFKKGVAKVVEKEDSATHFDLGIAYKEMGLFDDAIGEFSVAANDLARRPVSLIMVGICCVEKGKFNEAINCFKNALHIPSIAEDQTTAVYFEMGHTFELLKDPGEALFYFKKVFKRDPMFRDVATRLQVLVKAGAVERKDSEEPKKPSVPTSGKKISYM